MTFAKWPSETIEHTISYVKQLYISNYCNIEVRDVSASEDEEEEQVSRYIIS